MEDSHSVHLYIPPPGGDAAIPSTETIPEQPAGSSVTNDSTGVEGNAFFGVFDGHGGATVAKFTGKTIHSRLTELDAYSESVSRRRLMCREWRLRICVERVVLEDG